MNITKSSLSSLVPPKRKSDPKDVSKSFDSYEMYWDDKLKGFGIRITSAGVISYIVQARIKRKNRRKTIGRANVVSLEEARKLALAFLNDAARGIDPIEKDKQERIRLVSVQDCFHDYLKTKKNLKEKTITDMKFALNQMFHDWLEMPVNKITQSMVKNRHSMFGKQHSEARANLGMRYLRTVINFAITEYSDANGVSIIENNPVNILSKQKAWFLVRPKQTYIKSHELKLWYESVQKLHSHNARDCLLIAILTGLRYSELLGLKWENIDLNEKVFSIPDTKNGLRHTLPMSDYLYEIFKYRYDSKIGHFVFESERGRTKSIREGVSRVREASGISFSPHDLRRTFVTVADSLDLSYYAIKRLLNHKNNGDITARYIISDVDRLREPMQRITEYFLSAWGIKDFNIVDL